MPKTSEARERMIRSAMKLQRTNGVTGTAFADVIAHSGAPRGSIYHHFPQGRAQLAAEATTYGAEWIADQLNLMLEAGDPVAALQHFVELFSAIIIEEDFAAGCAVAAGALDPDLSSPARAAAHAGFLSWEALLAQALEAAGVAPDHVERLAVTCIAAIEGALILVRAEQSFRPFQLVADQLRHQLTTELDAARPHQSDTETPPS